MIKQALYDFLQFNKTEWLLLAILASVNGGILILRRTQAPIIVYRDTAEIFRDSTVSTPTSKTTSTQLIKASLPSPDNIRTRIASTPKHTITMPLEADNVGKAMIPFEYDPNTISYDSLRQMGVPEYPARNWIKYRASGGKFYRPEDINKIYGLSDPKQISNLIAYARIPRIKSKSHHAPKVYHPLNININTADLQEWQKLRGIGPYYARKIVSYRTRLGGFASIQQVRESPGLPDSIFLLIKTHLKRSTSPTPLRLNEVDYITLLKHPYVNRKQARLITKYRKQHGPFQSPEQLYNIRALDSNWIAKMRPYLVIERDISRPPG